MRRWVPVLAGTLVLAAGIYVIGDGRSVLAAGQNTDPVADGMALFEARCASCHGPTGGGTDLAPDIQDAGAAAADFVLSTGRMPPGEPGVQPQRRPPQFDDEEQAALVAFVASLGDGPDIPVVDIDEGDAAAGGVIFRGECAACHQAAGSGGVLTGGRFAPTLRDVTPVQIGEAMRIAPGAMPDFSRYGPQDVNNIAAYIESVNSADNPGGFSLGRVGPVAEGLVAWAVGLTALVLIALWIGRREPADDG